MNMSIFRDFADKYRDEVMYQARLHPEQYSNTFSKAQVKQLHDAIMYVCNTAVDTLAESEKFPEDWLMRHRWDKGKKNGGKLPNGAKITFLKVGGRTSAVVPSVQKKTGAVAGDVSESADEDGASEEEPKPKASRKRKSKPVKEEEDEEEGEEEEVVKPAKTTARTSTKRGKKQEEADEGDEEADEAPNAKKPKTAAAAVQRKTKPKKEPVENGAANGRRRSGRLSKD